MARKSSQSHSAHVNLILCFTLAAPSDLHHSMRRRICTWQRSNVTFEFLATLHPEIADLLRFVFSLPETNNKTHLKMDG